MNTLEKLMRACIDDKRILEHEAKLTNERCVPTLTRLAEEREQFITELERLAHTGKPRPSGSWGELLREASRDIWVSASGRNSGDAVATCRHSRARTEALYEKAMEESWPDEMRVVLEAQHHRLHDEAAELNRIQF